MNTCQRLCVLSFAVACCLGLTLVPRCDPPTAPGDAAARTAVATASGDPAPTPAASATAVVASPPVTAPARELRFPDGTTRPTLNGVADSLAPSFTDCVPFAPIVGTERDYHGIDWYVHANGVRSTSFRDGRGLPFACAYAPGMPRPVID